MKAGHENASDATIYTSASTKIITHMHDNSETVAVLKLYQIPQFTKLGTLNAVTEVHSTRLKEIIPECTSRFES